MAAGGSTGWTGRRPWWVWAAPFTFLFVLLCVRNRFLFTTRLYEQGDAGANSKQFICTSAQAARGQAYWFYTPLTPPAAPVILRFSGVAVAPAPSSGVRSRGAGDSRRA